MDIGKYILISDDFLPKDIHASLLEYMKGSHCKWEDALIIGKDTPTKDNKIRKNQIKYLNNFNSDMTTARWNNLLGYLFNKGLFGYQTELNIDIVASEINEIHLLKYTEGGFYDWHVDHSKKAPRMMSIILFINDDYEGGGLRFRKNQSDEGWIAEPKANRIVMWPSNFMFAHKVEPVKKGTRYSCVSWAV